MRFLICRLFLLFLFLPLNSISNETKEVIVFSKSFSNLLVKLAETEEEKQKGLMFKSKLLDTNGLLLLYKKPKIVKIWMHNTQIPLDIIFINEQNKVVLIRKGKPFSKKIISSITPIIGVLEIPEGCSKKLDIKVDDKYFWRMVNKTNVKNIRYYHCLDHF